MSESSLSLVSSRTRGKGLSTCLLLTPITTVSRWFRLLLRKYRWLLESAGHQALSMVRSGIIDLATLGILESQGKELYSSLTLEVSTLEWWLREWSIRCCSELAGRVSLEILSERSKKNIRSPFQECTLLRELDWGACICLGALLRSQHLEHLQPAFLAVRQQRSSVYSLLTSYCRL
jgi:hypothetical protein